MFDFNHNGLKLAKLTVPNVFLSHSLKDKELARRLAQDLTQNGVKVWFDKWALRIGDSLSRKIQEGISTSGFLAVILSPESVASKWGGAV